MSTRQPTISDSQGVIGSRSFTALLVTQFLGAVNDNFFRWLIVPIAKYRVGDEHASLALSAGLAAFVLPYLLLAAPAGYLADRFSKRTVMIACKVAEIAIMIFGVMAIYLGNVYIMFLAVFLMGAQSALFGPSKYGSIPEMVRATSLPTANGLIGMTTIVAVVLGTVGGNYLYHCTSPLGVANLWISALVLVGVAVVGWLASLFVVPLQAANPRRTFPWNVASQVARDFALLAHSRPLARVALGIAFFWSLASVSQLNVDAYGVLELGLSQHQVGPLLGALALGLGIGNVLAGFLSRGKVELGLVPIGAAGIGASSILLFASPGSYTLAALWLFTMGVAAGLFDVPLQAYLQHHSPRAARGSVLAASNFLTFGATIVMAGVFWLLRDACALSARQIFLACGLATLAVLVHALWHLLIPMLRLVAGWIGRLVYRIRVEGSENVPQDGGALLVSNHVSWIDGLLLLVTSSRPIRMVAYADYVQKWWIGWLANLAGVIPIRPGSGRKSILKALRAARQALRDGQLVCVFPEGAITRDGTMQAFKPGFAAIARGTGVPVVPVYLDGLWGIIFSYHGGRSLRNETGRRSRVSIRFGKSVARPDDPSSVRRAVQALGSRKVESSKNHEMTLPRAFLRQCRASRFRSKAADTTGRELSGGKLLSATLIFKRLLERDVLAPDEKYVGVLLPSSVGGVLANAALPLMHRIAVNLNYTVSSAVINSCIAQCQIRHVLTSRRVMDRLKLQLDGEVVFVEDLLPRVSTWDKLRAAFQAYVLPPAILERLLGLTRTRGDDVLTVLFTSGSTGEPKGVMLTHDNVRSNIQAINEVIHLTDDDVAAGVLPFFHSYGYTATMWTMLALPPKAVYHYTPLEAQQVGEMCRQHGVTILMSTPTFLRSYLKRCKPEDFATLDVVFASAEGLPKDLSDAFEQKFGVRPVEAYGATEMSPLISVNVPNSRATGVEQQGSKEGTVGRPIPGVEAKIVDPESFEDLEIGRAGMLLVKGPNVMKGYFNKPELTAEVIRDGWYVTGDIAVIDAGGFIQITGRESRFSKIGGEMVPHIKIEETLQRIVTQNGDEEELLVAVTAVPDARKGERIIVLHKPLDRSPEDMSRELAGAGLPNLWIPSPDSFCQVEELPVLGSGKLDLKALKILAMERFCACATSPARNELDRSAPSKRDDEQQLRDELNAWDEASEEVWSEGKKAEKR